MLLDEENEKPPSTQTNILKAIKPKGILKFT